MTACTDNGIFKADDWIKHEMQYVNDYFKKINVWDGITDQNIVSFRQTRPGLLFAFGDDIINEE